jgi:phospholipid-transporting ATPase
LIVAGEALTKYQDSKELKDAFLKVTDDMDVVIACRVTPKQKGDIVEMIRERYPNKMTLSIGDGANDVPMINKAHVGVGIAGREGMQAARSSDYAIGKFKFLKPLLFYHGREAYRRISYMICYSFYKNFLYVIVQFLFGFFSVFSGIPLYE